MSCRHLCGGPCLGEGLIEMTAHPCQAHPSNRTRGVGQKVGHMCLLPCHEVSNLRPMGFVASFGLEQNTTLIFSFFKRESDHLSHSHVHPVLPDLTATLFRGKGVLGPGRGRPGEDGGLSPHEAHGIQGEERGGCLSSGSVGRSSCSSTVLCSGTGRRADCHTYR